MGSDIKKLFILHTNDLHSFFEQMPKVATVIKQLRQDHLPDEVLTIDCGDHMDRMRMETEGSKGAVNIEVMNQTGYEIAVLGNNEGLTFTPAVLSEVYRQYAKFTTLGSNLYSAEEGKIPTWLAPYHIIVKNNLRIGLIGVTAYFTKFYNLLGWDIRDPFQVTADLVGKLREEVDIIVVLSHLGLSHDQRMAQEIEGIDLIFGAHTHHLLKLPIRIKDTYICCAGKFGEHVGEIELHYDGKDRSVSQVFGRCINVASYPNDPEIEETISSYRRSSEQQLNKACTVLKEPLSIEWNQDSPLGNLLAAGIRKWTDAEIGIVNSGQILQGLSEGRVTVGKLLEICPSPINPCKMWLSGYHIQRALEESLLHDYINLPIRGFGFRGKVLGNLCIDGMHVEYDDLNDPYEKITRILINGALLDPAKEYLVGTIDMFTFGVGYTSIKEGREIQFYLPEFIRDILYKQLLDLSEINNSKQSRWIKS